MQFTPTDYIDITHVATQKKNALYQHKSQYPDDIYFKAPLCDATIQGT